MLAIGGAGGRVSCSSTPAVIVLGVNGEALPSEVSLQCVHQRAQPLLRGHPYLISLDRGWDGRKNGWRVRKKWGLGALSSSSSIL